MHVSRLSIERLFVVIPEIPNDRGHVDLGCTVSLLRMMHEQGLRDRSALKNFYKDYRGGRAQLPL